MHFRHSIALATAMGVLAGLPAAAQPAMDARTFVEAVNELQTRQVNELFGSIQKLAATYLVLIGRTAIDLTYDSMTTDVRTGDLVIDGVTLFPELPWDAEGVCEVSIGRIHTGGASLTELVALSGTLQISNVSVPAGCLPPQQGGMLAQFGYDGLTIPAMTVSYNYDIPSAGASLLVQASIKDAAEVTVDAQFDYLWFKGVFEGRGDPVPVAIMRSAEVQIENRGIFERVEPLLAAQLGDLNAIPPMAQGMLGDMLSQGGSRPMSPAETALVENVATELARFIQNKDRIAIASAPEGGIALSEELFESMAGPQDLIGVFQPVLSAAPLSAMAMVSPSMLSTAMSGGAGMDDEGRLKAGRALITGIGAPRATAEGVALLAPLADAWNAEAAALSAEGLAHAGDYAGAYAMALRAMAGDAPGAIGMADRLEAMLEADTLLAAQAAAWDAAPGAAARAEAEAQLIALGNVAGMREHAMAAAAGNGAVRSYAHAYEWAILAAAAGDTTAAALRDRLDSRFDGGAGTAWGDASGAAASRALSTWTGGLASTVATRYGLPQ